MIYIYIYIYYYYIYIYIIYIYTHIIYIYTHHYIYIYIHYVYIHYIYIYTHYIYTRLRIKYNITTKHSVIQHQRGNPNWPLWLKTHCSTGEKISNAEAAARVTSSNWNIYPQHQPLEHNRVGNPRFAGYQP